MPRMSIARYRNISNNIDCYTVDNSYSDFDRNSFTCVSCNVKIEFSREPKNSTLGPFFKNWKNISHLDSCKITSIVNNYLQRTGIEEKDIPESIANILSMIIPYAKRLNDVKRNYTEREMFIKLLSSKVTKRFLKSIKDLSPNEVNIFEILTEDNQLVRLKDLVLKQDVIIEKLNQTQMSFVCILEGKINDIQEVAGGSIRLNLTISKWYNRTKPFHLFIPKSYVNKNEKSIKKVLNKKFFCYAMAEKSGDFFKMDLYSIEHQLLFLD